MNYSIKYAFSLIELMIVIVITAILATIAYPAYTDHMYKSRRVNAKAALLDYQARIERCYSDQFNYQVCADTILPNTVNIPLNANNTYYEIRITASNVSMYQITATANGIQIKDTPCRTFSIDNTGNQLAKDSSDTNNTSICWQ